MNFQIERLLKKVIKERQANNTQVWVAVAAGMGLGAILGILFAPESGKQLRSRMCSSCEEELEEEVIPRGKKQAESSRPKPKSSINELKQQAKEAASNTDEA